MRILFVATDLTSHGGMARSQRNLLIRLRAINSAQVEILSLNDKDKTVNGAGGSKILFMLKFAYLCLKFKPEIVVLGHLDLSKAAFLKMLIPRSKWHSLLHGIEAWFYRKELQRFYRFIDSYWSVSNYTKIKFAETNRIAMEKVKIFLQITNSVWDLNNSDVTYEPFFLSVAKVTVSEGYKGIDKTIEAIHLNEREMRDFGFKYVFVGSGDDLKRHVDLIAKYDLTDIVSVQQAISDEALKELYRTTSCSLLPSSGEGFGFVFIEAMAYGKACIGCKNCGSEDLIDHDVTGYLVDSTVEDIWKHMKLVMLHPTNVIKMGEAGFAKREREFKGDVADKNLNELLMLK